MLNSAIEPCQIAIPATKDERAQGATRDLVAARRAAPGGKSRAGHSAAPSKRLLPPREADARRGFRSSSLTCVTSSKKRGSLTRFSTERGVWQDRCRRLARDCGRGGGLHDTTPSREKDGFGDRVGGRRRPSMRAALPISRAARGFSRSRVPSRPERRTVSSIKSSAGFECQGPRDFETRCCMPPEKLPRVCGFSKLVSSTSSSIVGQCGPFRFRRFPSRVARAAEKKMFFATVRHSNRTESLDTIP